MPATPHGSVRATAQAALDDERTLAGQLHLHAGEQALRQGDYRAAEQAFLQAVEALPEHAAARLGLAEVWLMLGTLAHDQALLSLARQAAQQAAELDPTSEHARYLSTLKP